MRTWLLLAICLGWLGTLGCLRSADEESFRVKQATTQSPTPSPSVPPLASHISSQGEVTPQVAPLNLQPPDQSPLMTGNQGGQAVTNQATTGSDWGQQPQPSPTRPQPLFRETGPSFQVDLSAAVALPMTGPEGTMMGFSVDYRIKGALPTGPSPFVWVIEGQGGKIYRLPVRLESQGNLMLMVPEWRPEDGPFRCRIEDQMGRPISSSVDMR
ncbi:MAG: hypothetical protein ACUVQH_03310 [Thermogutta sp.]